MNTSHMGTVLIDAPRGSSADFDVSFLERNDHPVTLCTGPADGTICPILATGSCEKFEDAHGVIFELDLDRPQHLAIVRRYRQLNPDIPIRVLARADQMVRLGRELDDVELWVQAPTVAELDGFAAEVEAADR